LREEKYIFLFKVLIGISNKHIYMFDTNNKIFVLVISLSIKFKFILYDIIINK